ncbi:MAG: STAS domain-containing protein [Acidobacteriales bacterium]|nr:STAS domain-containing protein [Terriglobales bacterium]
MLLQIERQEAKPGTMVLKLNGRVTLGRSSQELEWEIDKLFTEGAKHVVLDVSNVDRIDSAGLGILAMASGKARAAGGDLRVAGAQGFVDQVIKMTKLESVFMLFPSVEAAVEGL